MKKKIINSKRWGLTLSLMLFVFVVIMAAMLTAGAIVLTLHKVGLLDIMAKRVLRQARMEEPRGIMPLFGSIIVTIALSTLLSLTLTRFFGERALNPIRKVIDAIQSVAAGDFSVRIQLNGFGELRELSQSFNKMTQELSSIETLRSDFINNISHEFKTPIGSIQGFAQLLQDGNLTSAEQQEYIAIIIAESKRLATLSTNILTLSKYENTEIVPERTIIPLDEQIRRVIALIEPKWAEKGIQLQVDVEEDVRFECNEDLTQQIWLNLLDNAIKFSPPNGVIHIRLFREGERITFSIRNEGQGMDEIMQARIFDKFYQGDASRAAAGSGLGLAIVKRITELHGGTVEVQSAPGQGSIFTVHLQ